MERTDSVGVARWRWIIASAVLLWSVARPLAARTLYVDGACGSSGDGSTLACGPTGPFQTIDQAVAVGAMRGADEPITIRVRGAHDGFDGVYRESVKLWGNRALTCSSLGPCVIEGCPAAACGVDETPVVSGFVTPTDWTANGAVFSRAVEAHGQAAEPAGTLVPPQQPFDAYFGEGSGVFNPVYLLEGPTRTALGYGGSCGGNLTTPCATAAQCPAMVACDATAPPDGFWALTCTGTPVTACMVHVNPHGSGDPRAGLPIWIPNRNVLLASDGRSTCPNGEAGCPSVRFLTLRGLTFEGTRWVGINLQDDEIDGARDIHLERLTVRYAPRFALRIQRLLNLTIDGLVMEEAGRGMAFDTGGTFGLRFFGVRHGNLAHITARHFGNAGRRDNQPDGSGDGPRPCDHCDPPWNDPATTVWSAPCDVIDVKQSLDVQVSDTDVVDIAGGLRIDASVGVRFDRGFIRRTRTGIIVNQLTPSTTEGFVRSYQITLSNLRMDENGDGLRGAINLGSNIDGDEVCLTPPQAGEFLRVYGNIISRSGLAGILVCENAKMCVGGIGGAADLGTCDSNADCPLATCAPADGTGRIEIYNNTIVDDRAGFASSGIVVRNGAGAGPAVADLRVLNNIVANIAGDAVEVSPDTVARAGVMLNHNLYFDAAADRACLVRWGASCHQTLTSLRAVSGKEVDGLEGDPLFLDPTDDPADLHITLASPARDTGVRITEQDQSSFQKDFDRQTRGSKWDIGADEFRCHLDVECDDGNQCNGAEHCVSGFCAHAPLPLDCNDGSPCTTDSCKPQSGCQHRALADGITCDDGDACSPGSSCAGGICVAINPRTCPPPSLCHLQAACDPDSGSCLESILAPDGTACNDGNRCTTGDACRAGGCAGRPCDDDPCTQCTLNGCEPVAPDSFDAVVCAFRRPLNPVSCSDQRVPDRIIEQFGAARALLENAGAGTACAGGRRSAYGRASFRLLKALKKLDQTQHRRARFRLTSDCFSALRGVLIDARHRAQSSAGACEPR